MLSGLVFMFIRSCMCVTNKLSYLFIFIDVSVTERYSFKPEIVEEFRRTSDSKHVATLAWANKVLEIM